MLPSRGAAFARITISRLGPKRLVALAGEDAAIRPPNSVHHESASHCTVKLGSLEFRREFRYIWLLAATPAFPGGETCGFRISSCRSWRISASATSLSRAHDRPHSGRRCVGSRRDGELVYLPVLPCDELGGVLSWVSSCSRPMLVAARSARHTWGAPAVSPRRRRTSYSSPSFTRALTSSVSTPSFDSTTPHTSRRSISA